MAKLFFRYHDSIKKLTSIGKVYVSDTRGKTLLTVEENYREKPFNWLRTGESRVITNHNKTVAIIKKKNIIIDQDEWEIRQTRENNFSLKKQRISHNDRYEALSAELGQWELSKKSKAIKFDGEKFIDNNSNIRGMITLHNSLEALIDTYCELETKSSKDYVIFAFLTSIFLRYYEYRAMGHNTWTV